MSATFSINDGQIIETSKKADVFSVLLDLPDNTKKLISPRDVRDAFFTTWASNPIKVTTPGNLSTEYIGIDSSNPSNRDIKSPILLGKRSYGNLDIMNGSLLSTNNADIFIYNTKPDSYDQNSTKVSILAGTSSNLWYTAPYIGASYSNSKIDLNLVNPSPNGGSINIVSTTGRVGINGVVFPTLSETAANAVAGKTLRYYGTYPNGFLTWDDPIVTLFDIGYTGSTTNVYGDPILLNGYPLEFIEDDQVPVKIGGIPQGFSFSTDSFSNSVTGTYSNWPLVEVIKKLIYPRVEPELSLSITNTVTGNSYSEVGKTASFDIIANIILYAKDETEYISDIVITGSEYSVDSLTRNPYGFSFSGDPGSTFSITTTSITFSSSLSTINYNFAVSDTWISGLGGVTASPSTYPSPYFLNSVTYSVSFIAPILSQFGYLDNTSFLTVANELFLSPTSSRYVENHPGFSNSISKNIEGVGYFYFGYPSIYNSMYGTVSKIKDPNGFIIHDFTAELYSAFTYSYNVVSSGTTYTNYTIFRTKLPCSYSGVGNFEFIF